MGDYEKEISRVTRTKEEAKVSYDKLSPWYDVLVGRSERRFKYEGLHQLGVTEGEKVLEIGFGTGECTLAIAESVGNTGKVYGIDISEGMLNHSHSRIEKAGLSNIVELRCGDATKLPFETNFFDAVFTSFTLELFDTPEISTVLHECHRVLKSGGRICVVAMSKEGNPTFMVKFYEWAHKKIPSYVDCRPIFVEKTVRDAGYQIKSTKILSLWRIPVEIVLAFKP